MDKKYCPKCETTKSVEEFGKNASKTDGLQSVCKDCKKVYGQQHYQKDKASYIARSKAARESIKAEVRKIKEADPCTDCGKFYPYYVMQFDHLSDKTDHIQNVLYKTHSLTRVLEEIAKCELVCANCHAARTWTRLTQDGVDEYGTAVIE